LKSWYTQSAGIRIFDAIPGNPAIKKDGQNNKEQVAEMEHLPFAGCSFQIRIGHRLQPVLQEL
jgi:hypothetical protein